MGSYFKHITDFLVGIIPVALHKNIMPYHTKGMHVYGDCYLNMVFFKRYNPKLFTKVIKGILMHILP